MSKIYFDNFKTVSDIDFNLIGDCAELRSILLSDSGIASPNFISADTGLTFKGTCLILDGSFKLRHYFGLNGSPDDYSLSVECSGKEISSASFVKEGNLFYVDIECNGVSNFKNQYLLTLKNEPTALSSTVTYGICNFVKNMV